MKKNLCLLLASLMLAGCIAFRQGSEPASRDAKTDFALSQKKVESSGLDQAEKISQPQTGLAQEPAQSQ